MEDLFKVGDYAVFTNHRGELVSDKVRAVFDHHALLEPYARNEVVRAVVLTNYSWMPVSKCTKGENLDLLTGMLA